MIEEDEEDDDAYNKDFKGEGYAKYKIDESEDGFEFSSRNEEEEK